MMVKAIESARFPSSLTSLSFGAYFNHPVEDAEFPEGLEGLYFGDGDKVRYGTVVAVGTVQQFG